MNALAERETKIAAFCRACNRSYAEVVSEQEIDYAILHHSRGRLASSTAELLDPKTRERARANIAFGKHIGTRT